MKLSAMIDLEETILVTRAELEALRTSPLACQKLDGLPHNSAITSQVESIMMKIEATEKKLESLADEYSATSARLAAEILQRTSGRAADLLLRRFVLGMTTAQIAADLHYSRNYVSYLISSARKKFDAAEPQS